MAPAIATRAPARNVARARSLATSPTRSPTAGSIAPMGGAIPTDSRSKRRTRWREFPHQRVLSGKGADEIRRAVADAVVPGAARRIHLRAVFIPPVVVRFARGPGGVVTGRAIGPGVVALLGLVVQPQPP